MIISGKQIQSVMQVYTENKASKTTKTPAASPSSRPDEVILSTQAQEAGQIYQAIKALPDVREAKVQEISDSIANGDYSVDAKTVADKMFGRIMADQLR